MYAIRSYYADLFGLQRVQRVDFAHFDGARAQEMAAMALGHLFGELAAPFDPVAQGR